MAIVRGAAEEYYDDQIVVALPDLNLIQKTLTELGVAFSSEKPHPLLRLARLRDLENVDAAVATLMQRADIGAGLRQYASAPGDSPGPVSSFDLLLRGLRLYFGEKYPHWQGPQFGKNRLLNLIYGQPVIGPGEAGDPVPTDSVLGPRAADAEPGRGVLVGLLDGRITPHVWLAGGYSAHPQDVIEPEPDYNVNQGHCTSVASCILSRAPSAHLQLRTILTDNGTGDVWTAAQQMAELASTGCDVVNISAGQCICDDGQPPLVLDTAVKLLSAHTILVAAAGNQGNVSENPAGALPGLTDSSVYYPAGCYDVVAVGALDEKEAVANFTPKDAPYIGLMAPGVDVTVAYLDGKVKIQHGADIQEPVFDGWAKVNGTSFSAGIVTGEIARRTIPGRVTAREALDQLLGTAEIDITKPVSGIIRPYRVGVDS